jgi:hypothetical protein
MLSLFTLALLVAEPAAPFAITVVDAATGRGVPLIELKTVHGVRYYTDSNGVVAFHEPGLMNESVFFYVSGHGYEHPKDGFGFRGTRLDVRAGGSATIKINRVNIAERLYRMTGAGIYRDSELVGLKVPTKKPVLNAQVFGSDSVVNAIYRGKLHWFWGDTQRPSYPLGNFHVPGATSDLPTSGGLDPDVGVDLTYYLDDKGFAKATAELPGKGPTWMVALEPLPDGDRERLFAAFIKIEPPLKVYAQYLAVWDDDKQRFEKFADVDLKAPLFPTGHSFRHKDNGRDYVYFASPYPVVRVPATAEAFRDPSKYEGFSCLKPGGRMDAPEIDRDSDGKLRFAWKANTAPIGPDQQAKLRKAGKLKAGEERWQLRDRDTGKQIEAHRGSIAWNDYRKRWTMLANEIGGKPSHLGEVWYSEADDPTGPWRYAVKVATHDRMSFYNPKQHPYFAKADGKVIYFEGTYTHDFSGNPDVTPRYEYNQMMYRLDLSDPRTTLPRPVPGTDFLALDREIPGTVRLATDPPVFVMTEGKDAAAANVPVYEFTARDGKKTYGIAEKLDGYERAAKAVGWAWRP